MKNSITYNGKRFADNATGKEKLMRASAFIGDALVADSLAVDSLTATVRNVGAQCLLAADEKLSAADNVLLFAESDEVTLDEVWNYGEPVKYYREDDLYAKFYLETMTRTGKDEYTLTCLSAIGMLLTSDHYGGVYNGETAGDVLEDIVGGIISYTMDEKLAATPVFGWLPKAKRRDNLRDLLFAIGGQIRKDTTGELNIIPMTAGEPYEIAVDDFYMGGSVTRGKPATAVSVTEHSFMALSGGDSVTLYDGESAAEELLSPQGKTLVGVLVDFPEPMYELTIQNAEILESGANYAVISGSPAAILKGKKYTHTERVITRSKSAGGTPNVVKSKSCTLVNLMNAELVADRLMAYYGAAKTVEADIVVTNQKPGDAVAFVDPFGNKAVGYISDMELTASAILKAKTTLISGYIPTSSGNYYERLSVVEENGTFTVPEDCKGKIRVVLIGGGNGGSYGESGEDGEDGPTYSSLSELASASKFTGLPGNGGAPGVGGLPGKVFVVTLSVKPGDTFDVVIGEGGLGAAYGELPGEGGNTTFGAFSSADGYSAGSGYVSLLGETYALPGASGKQGGRGQELGDSLDGQGIRPVVEYNGESWQAGLHAEHEINAQDGTIIACGGNGGGAAVGSDGGDGQVGMVATSSSLGGAGGKGATPVDAPDATVPGSGGTGGHGGGGGGGGGAAVAKGTPYSGPGGAGGIGGKGGKGAPGVALIYY